jgi:hypothetical protein
MFDIKVDCNAGYRGEQTPIIINFRQRAIQVLEVIDCWLSPNHRYFKIKGDDHAVYIIRHDPYNLCWQLSFYHQCSDLKKIDRRPTQIGENHLKQ